MAIGDKQAAVRECVDTVLINHRIPQPIDRTKSLADYHYVKQNMPPFHIQVKACLQAKHYAYVYDPTDDYMSKTVAMPLLQLYSTISGRTQAPVMASLERAGPAAVPKAKKAKKAKAGKAKQATARKAAGKVAKKPAEKSAKRTARK